MDDDNETQFADTCQDNESQKRRKNCHLFEIHKHNARELYPVVKALAFREHCAMTVCSEGVRIIVDDQHHEQGSAYFKYDQFSEFTLRCGTVHLRLPMNIFTETLNVFAGNSTAMRMHYDGPGEPLVVCMEDEGVVFNCAISTQTPIPILDFEFDPTKVLAKVIMSPQAMREVIRELDQSSPTVLITVTKSNISFYTDGDLGKLKTQIPSHSEQIELLECVEDRVAHPYRLALIRRMLATFALCNKVSLRMDSRGVLSSQFLIPQSDQQTVFVEFYCVADTDVYYQ